MARLNYFQVMVMAEKERSEKINCNLIKGKKIQKELRPKFVPLHAGAWFVCCVAPVLGK
jgi:hypothetical protein